MKPHNTFRQKLAANRFWIVAAGLFLALAALVLQLLFSPRFIVSAVLYPDSSGMDRSGCLSGFSKDIGLGSPDPDLAAGILRSRETAGETSILLVAQWLTDPASHTRPAVVEFRAEIPSDLARMIDSVRQSIPVTDTVTVFVTHKVRKYETRPKTYIIKAGDNPTRVARKFGLTLEQLLKRNHPMPPFQGGRRLIVALDSVSYLADTVIPEKRAVNRSVGEYPGSGGWAGDPSKTARLAEALKAYHDRTPDNCLRRLLKSGNPALGLPNGRHLRVRTTGKTGLIRVTLRSGDPVMGVQSLNALIGVAARRYRSAAVAGTSQLVILSGQDLERVRHRLDSLETAVGRRWFAGTPDEGESCTSPVEGMIRLWGQLDRARMNYRDLLDHHNRNVIRLRQAEQINLRVIEGPHGNRDGFPSDALPLMALGFLAGILIAMTLLAAGWPKGGGKMSPASFEDITGLPLWESFPAVLPGYPDDSARRALTADRFGSLSGKIRQRRVSRIGDPDRPFVIFVVSSRSQEGKTYIASKLADIMRSSGDRVLFLKPTGTGEATGFVSQFKDFSRIIPQWDREYRMSDKSQDPISLDALLSDNPIPTGDYHYILLELPALESRTYPAGLLTRGDLTLFVVKASRHQRAAEAEILRNYRSAAGHTVGGVLNFLQLI